MKFAVADLGVDKTFGGVDPYSEMFAEGRGVDAPADVGFLLDGKCFRQPEAVDGLDGDDVLYSAEIKIDGRRLAEHVVAFLVQADDVLFVDRDMYAVGCGLGRAAAKLFKISIQVHKFSNANERAYHR